MKDNHDGSMDYPSGVVLMKYMLENAEILFDEINNSDSTVLILDNGVSVTFDEEGRLIDLEHGYPEGDSVGEDYDGFNSTETME